MRTTAWAAAVTALEATGQGLLRLSETIDDIRDGMEREQVRREEQQRELDAVQAETRTMQEQLREAQRELEAQAERLADIDQLVKSIYEASTTFYLDTSSDGTKLIVLSHDSDAATLYALLPHTPIPQTLELQYHIYTQPRGSYRTDSNLVVFRWAQSEESLRSKPLQFTYVPDTTAESRYRALSRKGDRVFADDRPLPYGFLNHDPVMKHLLESGKARFSQDELQEAIEESVASEQ